MVVLRTIATGGQWLGAAFSKWAILHDQKERKKYKMQSVHHELQAKKKILKMQSADMHGLRTVVIVAPKLS